MKSFKNYNIPFSEASNYLKIIWNHRISASNSTSPNSQCLGDTQQKAHWRIKNVFLEVVDYNTKNMLYDTWAHEHTTKQTKNLSANTNFDGKSLYL